MESILSNTPLAPMTAPPTPSPTPARFSQFNVQATPEEGSWMDPTYPTYPPAGKWPKIQDANGWEAGGDALTGWQEDLNESNTLADDKQTTIDRKTQNPNSKFKRPKPLVRNRASAGRHKASRETKAPEGRKNSRNWRPRDTLGKWKRASTAETTWSFDCPICQPKGVQLNVTQQWCLFERPEIGGVNVDVSSEGLNKIPKVGSYLKALTERLEWGNMQAGFSKIGITEQSLGTYGFEVPYCESTGIRDKLVNGGDAGNIATYGSSQLIWGHRASGPGFFVKLRFTIPTDIDMSACQRLDIWLVNAKYIEDVQATKDAGTTIERMSSEQDPSRTTWRLCLNPPVNDGIKPTYKGLATKR